MTYKTEPDIILVVDDDQTFLQVLARSLRRKGYEAITADSVTRAQELLTRHTPDMAVVDLKMQGATGLTLVPVLKDLNPGMQVIVLTGYASIATAVEAMRLGARDYLCKPADTQQILKALHGDKTTDESVIPETPMSVEQLEWEHLQKVLHEHNGNISATARSLNMHRRTLQRKLARRTLT